MLQYRPDWLPKEESIVAYCASSQGSTFYRTVDTSGNVHIWKKRRPKWARKKRWIKEGK